MTKRSTYVSAKQHTRIRFTPLKWSCVLQCTTPQSPVTQKAYLDLEIAVDRTETACCILPVLTVNDPDGIMDTSGGNQLLSALEYSSAYDYVRGHEWYVDGQEISSVWEEGTDYEITYNTASGYNGMLTVYKNLGIGEAVTLQYRGVFTDTRLAMNRVVTSDTITLECLEAGDEEVSMTVAPSVIIYDPLRDKKLLAEYLEARGTTYTYDDDGLTYTRSATVTVLQGATALESAPDGYGLRWYLRGTDTEVTDAEDYIESIDGMTITFDLRCMEDTMLEVRLVNDDTEIVQCRCGIDLVYQPTTIASAKPASACDIGYSQDTYENEAEIRTAKGTVEYPECYYDITWKYTSVGEETTDESDEETAVECGHGEAISLTVDDIGMDKTTDDGGQFWLLLDVADREACTILMYDDDNELTDDDDNILLV